MRAKLPKISEEDLKDLENIPLESLPVELPVSLPPNEITLGDSLELASCVPAKTVDFILEDMPYNITNCGWDVALDLEKYWETRLRILKPTGVIALTATIQFANKLINSNPDMFKYDWVWVKERGQNFIQAKKQPLRAHELVLIFYNKFGVYNPQMTEAKEENIRKPQRHTKHRSEVYGIDKMPAVDYDETKRYPKTILEFAGGRARDKKHPSEKPVGLFEYLIRTYTHPKDLVFDGFGGSGTTAVAAYWSMRNFIVIEKEKKYFDLAVRRLAQARNELKEQLDIAFGAS